MSSAELSVTDINNVVNDLSDIVGAENVLDREEGQKQFTGDMSWITDISIAHGQVASRQDVVVSPRSTKQVAAIMAYANKSRISVTPYGGGSGVQGAANADRGGILLNLRGMDKVRHLDEQSMTCDVECGYICKDFEAWLNERKLSFTHYPASTEWATIGGSLAARGSGVLSTKYGKIEDHVLSIELVTPTGEILNTPAVPRHGAGPELTQLLIGSEGTLGVITSITVQLRNLPTKRVFGCFAFKDLEAGISAGRNIMTTGLHPAALRLYDEPAARHSLGKAVGATFDSPVMIVMCEGEYDSIVDAEADVVFSICREQGGKDLGSQYGEAWWDKRYVYYYPPFAPALPMMWLTMDVVADFTHIGDVYHATTKAIHEAVDPSYNMALHTHFSHWYDWGSMIYPRIKIPKGPDSLKDAMELHDKIVKDATNAALTAGAVINDHHGVGLRLAPYMKDQLGDTGMGMLQSIKTGLDPNNILCPGKLGLG
jgi:alkyldihydroxyacetonephosphate synthase